MKEFKSEYYRPLKENMQHYGITDEKTMKEAVATLQAPEEMMFSFAMFLLM